MLFSDLCTGENSGDIFKLGSHLWNELYIDWIEMNFDIV